METYNNFRTGETNSRRLAKEMEVDEKENS